MIAVLSARTSNSQYKLDPQSPQKKCLLILPLSPTVSKVLGTPVFHLISTAIPPVGHRWSVLVQHTRCDFEGVSRHHNVGHSRCTAPALAVLAIAESFQCNVSFWDRQLDGQQASLAMNRTGILIADLAAQATSLNCSHSEFGRRLRCFES